MNGRLDHLDRLFLEGYDMGYWGLGTLRGGPGRISNGLIARHRVMPSAKGNVMIPSDSARQDKRPFEIGIANRRTHP